MRSHDHTVRPHVRRGPWLGLCLVVFLISATMVYLLGYRKVESRLEYSAKAAVSYRVPAVQPSSEGVVRVLPPDPAAIERLVLSEESLRQALSKSGILSGKATVDGRAPQVGSVLAKVRQRLRVVNEGTADQSRIVIDFTGNDPRQVLGLVNHLAEQYAMTEQVRLEGSATRSYQEAHQAVERARQELNQATTRLDAFLKEEFKDASPSSHATGRAANAQPAMIGNPEWLDLDRQQSALQSRRAELLVDRTPLHPEIQHLDTQIAQLRETLSQTPRQIPNPLNDAEGKSDISDGEARKSQQFTVLRDVAEQARQQAERLGKLERQAWQRQLAVPQVQIHRAARCQVSGGPVMLSLQLLLVAICAGLALATGIGLVWLGLCRDRPVASLEEVQSLLPVPIVGVISHRKLSRSHKRSSLADTLQRPLTITYGAMLIGVCLLILVMAFAQA